MDKDIVVTQSMITSEIKELKESLSSQELTIPSLQKILTPGLFLFIWLIFCPWVVYGINGINDNDRVMVAGFNVFIGLMLFIAISTIRSQYLAFPETFRRNSNVMKILKRKGRFYYRLVVIGILFLSVLSSFSNLGVFAFIGPLIFSLVLSIFLITIDLGRYQLTALLAVIHELKNNNSKN